MNNPTLPLRITLVFGLTIASACLPHTAAKAQTARIGDQPLNLAALTRVPPETVPRFGNLYSFHDGGDPPLPGLTPAYADAGLPVYWLGGTSYLVDDTSQDWKGQSSPLTLPVPKHTNPVFRPAPLSDRRFTSALVWTLALQCQ